MKTAITLAFLGLAALVQPAVAVTKTISSAPIGPDIGFGGGAFVFCNIHNAGADPILLTVRSVLDASGAAKTVSNDSCGAVPLAPKHSCSFRHTADPISGKFVCRIKIKGPTIKVRGIAGFQNGSTTIMVSTPIE